VLREPEKTQGIIEPTRALCEKQRRFSIVMLEERIAPGNGNGNGSNATCGNIATCHKCYSK